MKKQKKPIKFKTEAEEAAFWSKADSTRYLDQSSVVKARFPELRPTTRPIPLRLPVYTIDRLKVLAHRLDIPYQVLMKRWIEEGIRHGYRPLR